MCGIAGFSGPIQPESDRRLLLSMLSMIKHRGPDDTGTHLHSRVALGHVRLSLVGIGNGKQPFFNEDKSIVGVCAGEIFNFRELRKDLEQRGHLFSTASDCEVLVHAYEEWGITAVERLNGQFAFALWDSKRHELHLGRDRLGVQPLFYFRKSGRVFFASEIKALFAHPQFQPEIDPMAVDQIFTFWTTLATRTMFKGVFELEPGHVLTLSEQGERTTRYWRLNFPGDGDYETKPEEEWCEALRDGLQDAVSLQMQADMPVGVYASGGLDSSLVAALYKKSSKTRIELFSVAFEEKRFDETEHQRKLARDLGVPLNQFHCQNDWISNSLESVVRHAEKPFLRPGPIPFFGLSKYAAERGFKAVLTGEGADEFWLGYDLFKECKVRRYWSRNPSSRRRPRLLNRLYAELPFIRSSDNAYMRRFFSQGLEETSDPFYSHRIRWAGATRLKEYWSEDFRKTVGDYDAIESLSTGLPENYGRWNAMAKAQHLEITLFMRDYLLASQGDRMAMAHGVELRHPFLDHRLVELSARIPPSVKMRGLHEKSLLRKSFRGVLDDKILQRPKLPYRAPASLLSDKRVAEALSPENVRAYGYFDERRVAALVKKASSSPLISENDTMALMGIATMQFFHELFIGHRVMEAA